MRVTDDGVWQEVTEEAYRAHLKDHPRHHALRVEHEAISRGEWWFAYDAEAFAQSTAHTRHASMFKVAYRVRETGKPIRFWIPAA